MRFTITVSAEAVEDSLDLLLPIVAAGVREATTDTGGRQLSWDGPTDEMPDAEAVTERFALRGLVVSDVRVTRETLPPEGAKRIWVIGKRLVLRRPDGPPAPPGLIEIVLERPGAAFGTGAHPTTRACLEMILRLEADGAFADLGCGTGVLAIVAARLGYRPVSAIDREPDSIEATTVNARHNNVCVDVRLGDLQVDPPPPARTLSANVPLSVHRQICTSLAKETAAVIVSGVTVHESLAAIDLYGSTGFRECGRMDEAGWSTLLMRRPIA